MVERISLISSSPVVSSRSGLVIKFLKSSFLILIISVGSCSLFYRDGSWCHVRGLGNSVISAFSSTIIGVFLLELVMLVFP